MAEEEVVAQDARDKAREIALARFAELFNCAEATAMGLAEAFDLDASCLPRIATGFGAGMGGWGEVCGALVGATMALGLRFGRDRADDVETKNTVYAMVRELLEDFEQEFGTIRCYGLTECDMRTPEGMQEARDRKLHTEFCPKFVAWIAEKAAEILARG